MVSFRLDLSIDSPYLRVMFVARLERFKFLFLNFSPILLFVCLFVCFCLFVFLSFLFFSLLFIGEWFPVKNVHFRFSCLSSIPFLFLILKGHLAIGLWVYLAFELGS